MSRAAARAIRPRVVFFDLGQVLCRFDWRPSIEALAARLDGVDATTISSWLLSPEGPHDAYCQGHIDERQLFDALHDRFDPQRRLEDAWLAELWCDIFSPQDGALELVDTLDGQCHRGLISNTNRLHFEWLDRRFRLGARLDSLTLSHEAGCLKPAAEIFETALRAARAGPRDVFYVDDLPEFVEAARNRGWQAEVFGGVSELARTLRDLGFAI
jgi:putative hydrolase of the HAD superfamily